MNARDVVPRIEEVVSRFSTGRIPIPDSYLPPGQLTIMQETFHHDHIALLTGTSLSGKTCMGRVLARDYQVAGYSYLETRDVYEAERFLRGLSIEDRVCLLDDPFGGIDLAADGATRSERLGKISAECSRHRKLVVTSRVELLRRLYGAKWATRELPSGANWHDITVRDRAFTAALWTKLSHDGEIDTHVSTIVSEGIEAEAVDDLLQPGQLEHLSRAKSSDLADKSYTQLCTIGREDSASLADKWRQLELAQREAVWMLALAATTTDQVGNDELKFMLSKLDDRPGFPEHWGFSLSDMAVDASDAGGFPQYPALPELSKGLMELVDQLESYGYLERRAGQLRFAHPNYQAAARRLLHGLTTSEFDLMTRMLTRGLACLSTRVAATVALALPEILQISPDARKEQLFEIAVDAQRSIFPRVREISAGFLIKHFDSLSESQQRWLLSRMRWEDIDLHLFWKDGIPWINEGRCLAWLIAHPRDDARLSAARLADVETTGSVSRQEAWCVAANLAGLRDVDGHIRVIEQLMNSEDAFIREKAAFFAVMEFGDETRSLAARVFNDENPRVVAQGVEGIFAGWPSFCREMRLELEETAKHALNHSAVATVLATFLTDFGDAYGPHFLDWEKLEESQIRDQWALWATLFPLFFSSLPQKLVPIEEGHLWNTTEQSAKYLDVTAGVAIASAWFEWIDRCLSTGMPGDYGLGVIPFLIKVSRDKPFHSYSLLAKILQHRDTAMAFTAIADCVDLWGQLADEEKRLVLHELAASRPDSLWLQAVALTRSAVPTEIVEAILGKGTCDEKANPVLSAIPGDLLECCLRVYCGQPELLWFLGKHHTSNDYWPDVLINILRNPGHNGLSIATKEMLRTVIYGQASGVWSDALDIWRALCINADDDLRSKLYRLLLAKSMGVVTKSCKDYWQAFFSAIPTDKELDRFQSDVAGMIEGFDYWADQGDLRVYFELPLLDKIVAELPSDQAILSTLHSFRNKREEQMAQEASSTSQFIRQAFDLYSRCPPRLDITHEAILAYIEERQIRGAEELVLIVKQTQENCRQRGYSISDQIRQEDIESEGQLEHWTSQRLDHH